MFEQTSYPFIPSSSNLYLNGLSGTTTKQATEKSYWCLLVVFIVCICTLCANVYYWFLKKAELEKEEIRLKNQVAKSKESLKKMPQTIQNNS